MAQTTKERRKAKHAENRRLQKRHPGRRSWRTAPATARQLAALRTIASANGRTFAPADVTRGEAWRRIREASSLLDSRTRRACAPPWYSPPTRK